MNEVNTDDNQVHQIRVGWGTPEFTYGERVVRFSCREIRKDVP